MNPLIRYVQNTVSRPTALLLMTGALLGANFPLGKIAAERGFSPMHWAWLISLGATITLFTALRLQGKPWQLQSHHLRFVVISGILSFVLPNLLLFSVIPHTGAGFSGMMFALSPVFTTAFSAAVGWERISKLGLAAVFCGLIGAATVSYFRAQTLHAPPLFWQLAALAIPIVLAVGNVYRSWDWPKNAAPDQLALWSQIFATLLFSAAIVFGNQPPAFHLFVDNPVPVFTQALVAGLMFPLLFRLQLVGGPILLSQIGYVAAAVGLLLATLFLGETYPGPIWMGAAVIAFGLLLTGLDRKHNETPSVGVPTCSSQSAEA